MRLAHAAASVAHHSHAVETRLETCLLKHVLVVVACDRRTVPEERHVAVVAKRNSLVVELNLQLAVLTIAVDVAHNRKRELEARCVLYDCQVLTAASVGVGHYHEVVACGQSGKLILGGLYDARAYVVLIGIRSSAARHVDSDLTVAATVARGTYGRCRHVELVGLGYLELLVVVVQAAFVARLLPVGDYQPVLACRELRCHTSGNHSVVLRQLVASRDSRWVNIRCYIIARIGSVPTVAVVASAFRYLRINLSVVASVTEHSLYVGIDLYGRVQFVGRLRYGAHVCIAHGQRIYSTLRQVASNVVRLVPSNVALAVPVEQVVLYRRGQSARHARILITVFVGVVNAYRTVVDVAVVGHLEVELYLRSRLYDVGLTHVAAVGVSHGQHVRAWSQSADILILRSVTARSAPRVAQVVVALSNHHRRDGTVVVATVARLVLDSRSAHGYVLAIAQREVEALIVLTIDLAALVVSAIVGNNESVVTNRQVDNGHLVGVVSYFVCTQSVDLHIFEVGRRTVVPRVVQSASVARHAHAYASVGSVARARRIGLLALHFEVNNLELSLHRALSVGVVVPHGDAVLTRSKACPAYRSRLTCISIDSTVVAKDYRRGLNGRSAIFFMFLHKRVDHLRALRSAGAFARENHSVVAIGSVLIGNSDCRWQLSQNSLGQLALYATRYLEINLAAVVNG